VPLPQLSVPAGAPVAAGTMLFGEGTPEAEAPWLLDAAAECGINFFDSAEMYPVPQRAATQGASERILGAWVARRRRWGAARRLTVLPRAATQRGARRAAGGGAGRTCTWRPR